MKTNILNQHLIDNNIKPLTKRLLIYNYLVSHRNHPTVETIYKDLIPNCPTLSKTTIYNTLNLFLENNLVQALHIEGTQLRYDADVESHGHFKCETCKKVYDFEVDKSSYPEVSLEGFAVLQKQYTVIGKCKACITTSKN